jgi:hypothetical protein
LVIAVLEGHKDSMLIYRYLRRQGYEGGQIRVVQAPRGQGSAESWVKQAFVIQVPVYRTRQAKTGLIVAIDADNYMVRERLNQLDEA